MRERNVMPMLLMQESKPNIRKTYLGVKEKYYRMFIFINVK